MSTKEELFETTQKLKAGFSDVIEKIHPSPAATGLAAVQIVMTVYYSFKEIGMESGMKAMVNATRDALKAMEADLQKLNESTSSHAE